MIRSFEDKSPKVHPSAWVSEAAYVVGDVEIGEGSSVWPCAVIRADFGRVVIGKKTNVQDTAVIHGDKLTEIGDNVTIGHGVIVHCRKVGSNVLLGMNATLLADAVVGDRCIVAANTVVSVGMKVPTGSMVVGSPAQVKPLKPGQAETLGDGGEYYAAMAQRHKKNEEARR